MHCHLLFLGKKDKGPWFYRGSFHLSKKNSFFANVVKLFDVYFDKDIEERCLACRYSCPVRFKVTGKEYACSGQRVRSKQLRPVPQIKIGETDIYVPGEIC